MNFIIACTKFHTRGDFDISIILNIIEDAQTNIPSKSLIIREAKILQQSKLMSNVAMKFILLIKLGSILQVLLIIANTMNNK